MTKRMSRRQMVAGAGVVVVLAMGAFAVGGDPGGTMGGGSVSAAKLRMPASYGADVEADESFGAVGAEVVTPTAGAAVAATGGAASGGEATAADAGGTDASAAPLPAGIGVPNVVKTATVEVEVADGRFDVAFSKVPTIAATHGGFVASSTSSVARDDERQAAGSLVVRVPADRFDVVRQELAGLGKLRSQQLRGDDVGGRMTDLDARLRNLRTQEDALRLLMEKTKTVGETIEVQRQLSGVREQIEQLAGEQARLADAVALSTITVSLFEPGAGAVTPPGPRSGLAGAFQRALEGAQSVLAAAIVAVGYLLPLAVLLALAALLVRPVLRLRRTAA